jgi:uncharacterized membrane protein HdeD (DUF308 family)
MTFPLAINWWSVLFRGLLAILIGFIALAFPGVTISAFVFLFAVYVLVDGVLSLTGALRAVKSHERWGSLLIEGIAGIAAAVITVLWPAITVLTLVYVIAAWAIVTGVFEIAAAARLREYISGEWILALSGIASIVFGVVVAAVPGAGALVIAIWFGVYEVVFGVLLVALGFRLRSWKKGLSSRGRIPAAAH